MTLWLILTLMLLGYCIPFAQDMLKKRDEFYPFAVVTRIDGAPNPIGITDGNEHPVPSQTIEQFISLLRQLASDGDTTATAICYDGRVTVPGKDKTDAITVALEHTNGEAMTIYLPYKKKLFGGYNYGDIIGNSAERLIFV